MYALTKIQLECAPLLPLFAETLAQRKFPVWHIEQMCLLNGLIQSQMLRDHSECGNG